MWVSVCLGLLRIGASLTSQRERVPQSMQIQHSQANIKGDMSNSMKNIQNFNSYF